ncbi:MAG: hypothetical protein NT144_11305 [Bacteroidia bacterium]|nr:hypothetical protein [Bacteroidia bacterium]
MKIITLFAILIQTGICAYGQNLIGYNDKEIRKYMKENRAEMNFNKVTNSKFKYLKYSDNSDSQTMLFFLDRDSVCKSVRLICDLSVKADKVKEFNSIYKTSGENRWIDKREGKDYMVEIVDGKWSCIITIEHDK